jgi:hypothetical protein
MLQVVGSLSLTYDQVGVSGGLIPDHIGEVVFVDMMGHSITIPVEKLDKETYRIDVQLLTNGLYFTCTPGIGEYLKVIISQ